MLIFRTMMVSLFLLIGVCTTVLADPDIQVAAAANVQAVLSRDLIPMFMKQTGDEVDVNYGATGLLEKQVENGSATDVFISADDATVKKLIAGGFLAADSEQPYAVGQLVVVLRPGLEGRQASVAALDQTWVTKVAIADPKVAPYGQAAVDAMEAAGVYDDVVDQERLTIVGNVQEAYDAAQTLNADAAITALSLVIKVRKANYSIVPQRYYKPLAQTLGVSPNASPAAKQFAAFLVSPAAQAVFKEYGYLPPRPLKKK